MSDMGEEARQETEMTAQLGIPSEDRIEVELVGKDGNIFNLLGITRRAMKNAGQEDKARELLERVTRCSSYDEALNIIGQYVDIC